jgi:hypothetical protein
MEGCGDAHSPHGTASPSSHLHSMHTGPSAGISAPAKLPLSEEGRAYLSDSGTSEDDEEEDERAYAPTQVLAAAAAAAAAAPNGHAHLHATAAAPTANGVGSSNRPPTPTQPAAAALHSDSSPTAAAAAGLAGMELEDETLTIRIPASDVPTAPPAGVLVPQPLSSAEISALHSQQQQQHNGELYGSGSPSAAHSAAGGWGAAKAELGSPSHNSSSSSMHAPMHAPPAAASAAAASRQPPEEELPPPLPEPDVIVPCMLGDLAVEPGTGDHVCSGKWGMTKDAHLPGGSVSPFEFRLTAAQLAYAQQQPPVTGSYAAFFIVKISPKTRETVRN